ncbi:MULTISPECIES: anti-sigma factor [Polaromonas]|uniref:Anti-sigma factor domain-containing protein n=1 Tax=Polaromonas aquatica TaxID=332657 RepID=A0ABW1U1U6_9BURK
MNLTQNPSLVEQLAASYALGTLRGGARRRFEALAREHAQIRAAALIWQGRLASVAELQPQAAPSPAVWKRIENLVRAEKEAKAMQAARGAVTAVAAGPGWWASLNLWRGASFAGAAVAVLAVVAGVNLSSTNSHLDGQVASLGGQVKELSAKLSATPEIRYVAVLADDKSAASMLVTFDPKNQRLLLKRVGGFQEQPDKSLQLWALPQTGAPKSLGVLGNEPVVRLAATGNDVREVPALAISLEPKGGVPAGSGPTGPVLFKGALIETAL